MVAAGKTRRRRPPAPPVGAVPRAFIAPRILKLPGCAAAAPPWTSSRAPRRSLSSGDSSSGVRTATPPIRRAAAHDVGEGRRGGQGALGGGIGGGHGAVGSGQRAATDAGGRPSGGAGCDARDRLTSPRVAGGAAAARGAKPVGAAGLTPPSAPAGRRRVPITASGPAGRRSGVLPKRLSQTTRKPNAAAPATSQALVENEAGHFGRMTQGVDRHLVGAGVRLVDPGRLDRQHGVQIDAEAGMVGGRPQHVRAAIRTGSPSAAPRAATAPASASHRRRPEAGGTPASGRRAARAGRCPYPPARSPAPPR